MYSSTAILLIFCLSLIINIGRGLKCYQCQLRNGKGDVGCGENPPPSKYLRDCAQPQCWLKYMYSSNGSLHIERYCVAWANNLNGCQSSIYRDNRGGRLAGLECKCSHAHGCNSKFVTTQNPVDPRSIPNLTSKKLL